jgi:uncharacterized iron-regulated membrane protein
MDDATEIGWRKALQARGRDWVMSELHTRPGRPEDAVLDVVFEQPYPTRAFCMQWCAEQENRIFRMSWHAYAALFALILFIICLTRAVQTWNAPDLARVARSATAAAGAPPAAAGNSANVTNSVPSQDASSANGAATDSSNDVPSICAYIRYDTTRCKVQNRSLIPSRGEQRRAAAAVRHARGSRISSGP